jgi:hypothetical protein
MDNSLEEIQQEHDRLLDAKNLEASLRFQRQCLMGVVTGAEFMNSKFNPFDWELDGWSESVHENIEDFDEVFEELYDKYKGRGNMPPEAKLMMSLVGSGFMFHMSNSFFRTKMSNMTPDDIFRNNPQLAKQFAAAAAQQAGQGFGNFMGAAMGMPSGPQQMPQMPQMPQQMPHQMPMNGAGSGPSPFYQASNAFQTSPPIPQPSPSVASAPASSGPRREMRGPSGVDDILKTFQEVRAAEVELQPVMIPSMPSPHQQPAVQLVRQTTRHRPGHRPGGNIRGRIYPGAGRGPDYGGSNRKHHRERIGCHRHVGARRGTNRRGAVARGDCTRWRRPVGRGVQRWEYAGNCDCASRGKEYEGQCAL